MSRAYRVAVAAALVLGFTGEIRAQQVPATSPAPATCPAGQTAFGHIGILDLDCAAGCEYAFVGPAGPSATFRSEPRIRAMDPYIARANGLREGDLIVAVDGHLITTREGARRFVTLTGGQPTELRIRRGDREHTLQITPLRACGPATPASAAPSGAGSPGADRVGGAEPDLRPAAGGAQPVRAAGSLQPARTGPTGAPLRPFQPAAVMQATRVPLEGLPAGALGFAIECDDCGSVAGGPLGGVRWVFRSPPRIYSVEAGGPAARAGLRRNDQIVAVNGLQLTTPEGARAFTSVRPGDRVQLEYRRLNTPGRTLLVAEEPAAMATTALRFLEQRTASAGTQIGSGGAAPRPGTLVPYAATLAATPAALPPLRFTGLLGEATIEVHSPHRVSVTEAGAGGEIEIVIGDSVVRVRLPAPSPDR